jgi:hypothetical protein
MTATAVMHMLVILAAGVAGVSFWASGQAGVGTLLLLAALAAAFLLGPAILGDSAGIERLPDGVTAADVKEHRKRHGGSISVAVRALRHGEG